jgi:hypothetical protein
MHQFEWIRAGNSLTNGSKFLFSVGTHFTKKSNAKVYFASIIPALREMLENI